VFNDTPESRSKHFDKWVGSAQDFWTRPLQIVEKLTRGVAQFVIYAFIFILFWSLYGVALLLEKAHSATFAPHGTTLEGWAWLGLSRPRLVYASMSFSHPISFLITLVHSPWQIAFFGAPLLVYVILPSTIVFLLARRRKRPN
jgi:hypothetical protein